jgi:hypothetical protein
VQTQKDHVEAYSFLIGRMTSALVLGDAGYLEVPARRAWTGVLIGIGLAVLTAAGFFIFGLFKPLPKPQIPTTPTGGTTVHGAAYQPFCGELSRCGPSVRDAGVNVPLGASLVRLGWEG